MDSATIDIEKYIEVCNVSVSNWWYTDLEQKYSGIGDKRHATRMGPKYDSAIIDKLFFDIDCLTDEGVLIQKGYDTMRKIWDWATENDFIRDISFTGGGYQLCVGTKVRAEFYWQTMNYLIKSMDLYVDPNISLTDMRRYIGSYNFGKDCKSPRQNYCISLKDWEVRKSWGHHLGLSFTKRTERYKYGKNYYMPEKINVAYKKREFEKRANVEQDASVDKILEEYGYTYNDICESMRDLIEKTHVGHTERLYIIEYLKTIIGMKYGDLGILLPKILTAGHGQLNDGYHSLEEGQLDNVFSKQLHFNPIRMREDGYCDPNCNECDRFLELMRNVVLK